MIASYILDFFICATRPIAIY